MSYLFLDLFEHLLATLRLLGSDLHVDALHLAGLVVSLVTALAPVVLAILISRRGSKAAIHSIESLIFMHYRLVRNDLDRVIDLYIWLLLPLPFSALKPFDVRKDGTLTIE